MNPDTAWNLLAILINYVFQMNWERLLVCNSFCIMTSYSCAQVDVRADLRKRSGVRTHARGIQAFPPLNSHPLSCVSIQHSYQHWDTRWAILRHMKCRCWRWSPIACTITAVSSSCTASSESSVCSILWEQHFPMSFRASHTNESVYQAS